MFKLCLFFFSVDINYIVFLWCHYFHMGTVYHSHNTGKLVEFCLLYTDLHPIKGRLDKPPDYLRGTEGGQSFHNHPAYTTLAYP